MMICVVMHDCMVGLVGTVDGPVWPSGKSQVSSILVGVYIVDSLIYALYSGNLPDAYRAMVVEIFTFLFLNMLGGGPRVQIYLSRSKSAVPLLVMVTNKTETHFLPAKSTFFCTSAVTFFFLCQPKIRKAAPMWHGDAFVLGLKTLCLLAFSS
jgi:hypothetical protein